MSLTDVIAPGGATHLECTRCGARYESEALQRLSPCCEKPLYPRYDLDAIGARLSRDDLAGRSADLWRYAELLPVRDPANAVRGGRRRAQPSPPRRRTRPWRSPRSRRRGARPP